MGEGVPRFARPAGPGGPAFCLCGALYGCVCLCVCVRACACVCVCVCVLRVQVPSPRQSLAPMLAPVGEPGSGRSAVPRACAVMASLGLRVACVCVCVCVRVRVCARERVE